MSPRLEVGPFHFADEDIEAWMGLEPRSFMMPKMPPELGEAPWGPYEAPSLENSNKDKHLSSLVLVTLGGP